MPAGTGCQTTANSGSVCLWLKAVGEEEMTSHEMEMWVFFGTTLVFLTAFSFTWQGVQQLRQRLNQLEHKEDLCPSDLSERNKQPQKRGHPQHLTR